MSKFLALRMPLDEVILRSTWNPAREIHQEQLGHLSGLVLLLLSSINYALSLGFILTFTLVSMAGVAMLHTWRNLAHLRLRPGAATRCSPARPRTSA